MSTINYLNGSSLTSTALTDDQIQLAFQVITAQMLGLVMFQVSMILESGSAIAIPSSMDNLAVGQMVNSSHIPNGPPAATILEVGATTITLDHEATANVTETVTVSDPGVVNKVRIAYQVTGQPGPPISTDTVTLYCVPIDNPYSRMRDIVGTANETTITQTDVFTRVWRTHWTFYGPDGLDNARAIRSALDTIQFVADFLSDFNLYVNPSIKEPERGPQEFQGRWWERIDLQADFNEQITETFDVGLVESVEVKVYDKDGLQSDFTVTLPS